LNKRRLVGVENPRVGEKNEKNNKTFMRTMNENPKCHLHIPQPKQGNNVLNIIAQNLLEKKLAKFNWEEK
jgi:hypothetical protein